MSNQGKSTPLNTVDGMVLDISVQADEAPSSMDYDSGMIDTTKVTDADLELARFVLSALEDDPIEVAFKGSRHRPDVVRLEIQKDLKKLQTFLETLDAYKNLVEEIATKHSEDLKVCHVVLGTNNRNGNTATKEWRTISARKFKRKEFQAYYATFRKYYDKLRRTLDLDEGSNEIAFVKEVDAINTEQAVFEYIKSGVPTFKDSKSGTFYKLATTEDICKSMGWRGDSEPSPKGAASTRKKRRGPGGEALAKSQVDELAEEVKKKLDLSPAIEDQIAACKTKRDFFRMVDTGSPVHEALLRIEGASTRFGRSIDEFAEDWARRLALGNDKYAIDLQKDKNLAMSLVYVACDRCFDVPYDKKKNVEETLSEQDLVDLGTRVVIRILAACLPLNRYDALYRLKLPGNTEPGVHWYSQQDVDQDQTWYAINQNYAGKPTVNKRLVWLMEVEGLELMKNPAFVAWMQPQMAPSHAV